MTKKEIVKTIAEKINKPQQETKIIVQETFDAIVDTLVKDTRNQLQQEGDGALGRIELRNFGVFEVKRRAARKARNPRTGEKVLVAEKFVVTFKPGKEMEERIRNLSDREPAAETDSGGADASKRMDSSSAPSSSSGTVGSTSTGGTPSTGLNTGS